MNTADFLSIPAAIVPEQELIVFEGRRQTYRETVERVNRLTNALAALGVSKGDRLAVLDTNSSRYVEAYFAASKLGVVFVPLNYRAKAAELEYLVAAADTRVLLVGDRYVPLVTQVRDHLPGVAHYIALEAPQAQMIPFEELVARGRSVAIEADVDEEDVNILMYTSGTTGRPKGVMLTYGDFVAYVCGNIELADGTPRGAGLLCVPLYHIAGMTTVMTSCFTGRLLVILRQFEPTHWLETVQRERVTHAFLVPTMVKRVIEHADFHRYDCSSLDVLAYGAAPMPLPVIRRAIELFPPRVGFVNAFGQTETTATVTMLLPEDHRLQGTPQEIEAKLHRLSSIGRPMPDVELKLVDAEGDEVPTGVVGEIAVRTPRLMKGYASQADATAQTIIDGWLYTRDMGWMDETGYLYLAGRKDDLIIRGGENISPAEVEAVLHAHPSIEEACVIGVPDLEWGEQVVAIVVPKAGVPLTETEVMQWCHQRLASFKTPEAVHFVRELPQNALGKVLRKELRQQFARP